jgi:hypothetical protein
MSKGDPVTYEELTPEHKQKFDEIKALFEADLIGSFERTRHHDIRWKGFSPEGALDGVDLSLPSEERTRALCQEVNYMVAHSLHRHSESLVNAFECVALRVVQEIMKNQYFPTGPTLESHKGELPFQTRPPLPCALAALESHGLGTSNKLSLVLRQSFKDEWYSPSTGMEEIEWQIMLEQFVASGVVVKDEIIDIDNDWFSHVARCLQFLSTL